MTSGIVGADVARLIELAQRFDDSAERFEEIVAVIDTQVSESVWVGADAESFAETWQTIREQLLARVREFRDMALNVRGQAEDQRATSADSDASSGSGAHQATPASSVGGAPGAFPVRYGGGPVSGDVPGGGGSRQTLEEIYEKYQVSESTMVDYEPKWPLSLFTDPQRITQTEANLLHQLQVDKGALGLKSFRGAKEDAMDYASERFSGQGSGDGHQDAFRHAMWNALMTDKFGEEWAEDYGTAHEQQPNSRPASEAMDLHNNEVGRRIAAANPDASTEKLADLVEKAVRDGEMVVIGPDGNLARSNEVPPGGTGLAPKISNGPKGTDPEFNTDQY